MDRRMRVLPAMLGRTHASYPYRLTAQSHNCAKHICQGTVLIATRRHR